MNRTLTQLNAITKPYLSTLNTLLQVLCLLSVALVLSAPAWAQTNNCPDGDPLQWDWMQNLIQSTSYCSIDEVRQFEYEGATYFYATPRAIDNGVPCQADFYPENYYNCNGEYVCEWGLLPPDDPKRCSFEIKSAGENYRTIWVYQDEPSRPVFEDYPWLNNVVNQNTCSNETIIVYDAGSYNFLYIQSDSNGSLYYQDGTFYCSDAPGYSCVAAYRLSAIANSWICNNNNTNDILGCTDSAANNYNTQATTDDGSCTYTIASDCSNYTGTFFYRDCGGISYYFIQLEDGRIFDPYFADGIGFTPYEGQVVTFDYVPNTSVTTPCSISEAPITITCVEEVRTFVFEAYPWLNSLVDANNCTGEVVKVYDFGSYDFITIENASRIDVYYQNGAFYCSGTFCIEAYGLYDVADSWTCGDAVATITGCTNLNAINYNAAANEDDGSCIEAGNCANYSGTFIFENCGGTQYYFIQLTDGRILDPYFADGINFTPTDGQAVNFDYIPNTDITTPCSFSEAAVTITCIQAIRGFVFDEYPWLRSLINIFNCNGESVKIYDEGRYQFVSIESSSSTDLYYQDGSYYCSDAPGYSCVAAYGLTNVANSWSCGELPAQTPGCTDPSASNYNASADTDDGSCEFLPPIEFDFTEYPWLNALVNPINCADEVIVTEYDFGSYAFIYIKTISGGSLYINTGTFYCSDTNGESCLNTYNLSSPSRTWACSDGGFQKFDYVYTICAGESVDLIPNGTELIFIPCVCPPCGVVGLPSYPPEVDWMPLSCDNCTQFTVSPTSDSIYSATAQPYYYGDSGCSNVPGGWPPILGPRADPVTTTFLVKVEQCPPAKTTKAEQQEASLSFNIYPNPTSNKVFIDLPDEAIYQINLISISGKVIKQIETNAFQSTVEMNVSDLAKGMYLIELENETSRSIQKLIIK